MRPSHLAWTFLGSFLAITFLLQWWQRAAYPFELWLILAVLGSIAIVGLVADETQNCCAYICAILLGMALSLFAVGRTTISPAPSTVGWFARGKTVTLFGTIADEPDRRPPAVRYILSVRALSESGVVMQTPVSGRVLVTDAVGWPERAYGDKVTARGSLTLPGTINGFRYDNYLSISGISAVMMRARIEDTGERGGNILFGTLLRLKQRFEARINKLFPEPHASLAAGLLTGSRRGIPEHLSESFMRSGLTHIVAISGFNITIVITLVLGALFWLPLKWRLIPAALSIVAFTVFVGASASVVRAAIMGILGLFALTVGRRSDVRLAILWTAFLMLLWNPKYLWYDGSFQLSFAAVIGLAELSPLIKPSLTRLPDVLGMREALEATIAAQLSSVPVALLIFGNLSLVAPFANILVAPAIPLAMLLCALAVLTSYLAFPLGQLLAFAGWAVLQWIILVAESCARIPFAALHFEHVSIVVILAYYIGLIAVIIRHHRIKQQ
ncbi:MAG: ComEC/Rec2 family competence protein [Candidatus Peribacteraceae bacterium]|nr:ComEC/Rec2 family competence protein [Candidatus Peribacteraceae bacterium]MDD5742904.1 ComEC/Rec2 family competence protein [Candidatus Peribacteraceae bacterium]